MHRAEKRGQTELCQWTYRILSVSPCVQCVSIYRLNSRELISAVSHCLNSKGLHCKTISSNAAVSRSLNRRCGRQPRRDTSSMRGLRRTKPICNPMTFASKKNVNIVRGYIQPLKVCKDGFLETIALQSA
jgi:hypothetical protein